MARKNNERNARTRRTIDTSKLIGRQIAVAVSIFITYGHRRRHFYFSFHQCTLYFVLQTKTIVLEETEIESLDRKGKQNVYHDDRRKLV